MAKPTSWSAAKVAAALRNGLAPLLCVGETRDERAVRPRPSRCWSDSSGRRWPPSRTAGCQRWAVAYEPVWAIGTGETATPEIAQEAHRFLRGLLAQLLGRRGSGLPILYGGSVTPDNAASLSAQPDIDGFLVGGASLDPEKFLGIIRASG